MAISQVQIMNRPDKYSSTEGKKGGGQTGQAIGAVLGGVVGGMAGSTTANPAGVYAGAMGGAATGASLGSAIGEKINPTTEGTTAIDRRIQSQQPDIVHSERSEKLKQSLVALQSQPPEIQQQYLPTLTQGYIASVADDNPKKRNPWEVA